MRYRLRTLLILLAVLPPLLWVGWGKFQAWRAEQERLKAMAEELAKDRPMRPLTFLETEAMFGPPPKPLTGRLIGPPYDPLDDDPATFNRRPSAAGPLKEP